VGLSGVLDVQVYKNVHLRYQIGRFEAFCSLTFGEI
jgi:hypothetical protein